VSVHVQREHQAGDSPQRGSIVVMGVPLERIAQYRSRTPRIGRRSRCSLALALYACPLARLVGCRSQAGGRSPYRAETAAILFGSTMKGTMEAHERALLAVLVVRSRSANATIPANPYKHWPDLLTAHHEHPSLNGTVLPSDYR